MTKATAASRNAPHFSFEGIFKGPRIRSSSFSDAPPPKRRAIAPSGQVGSLGPIPCPSVGASSNTQEMEVDPDEKPQGASRSSSATRQVLGKQSWLGSQPEQSATSPPSSAPTEQHKQARLPLTAANLGFLPRVGRIDKCMETRHGPPVLDAEAQQKRLRELPNHEQQYISDGEQRNQRGALPEPPFRRRASPEPSARLYDNEDYQFDDWYPNRGQDGQLRDANEPAEEVQIPGAPLESDDMFDERPPSHDMQLAPHERARWAKLQKRVAYGHSCPEVEEDASVGPTVAGLFLPIHAPLHPPPGPNFRPLGPEQFGVVGTGLGESVYCAAYHLQSMIDNVQTAVNQASGVRKKQDVSRLLALREAASVGRVRTAVELEQIGFGLGDDISELIGVLRHFIGHLESGALHCRDPFQGAVLYEQLSKQRQRVICIADACLKHRSAAQTLEKYFRQRVIGYQLLADYEPESGTARPPMPKGVDPKVLETIRLEAESAAQHWANASDAFKCLADACRTFVDAYGRMEIKVYIGNASPPYILLWARIWITAWKECRRGFLPPLNTAHLGLVDRDNNLSASP